jgi:hypothetical protein
VCSRHPDEHENGHQVFVERQGDSLFLIQNELQHWPSLGKGHWKGWAGLCDVLSRKCRYQVDTPSELDVTSRAWESAVVPCGFCKSECRVFLGLRLLFSCRIARPAGMRYTAPETTPGTEAALYLPFLRPLGGPDFVHGTSTITQDCSGFWYIGADKRR